jgi:predicted RNA polymerase sigma factor
MSAMRILLADDESLAEGLRAALRRAAYTVHWLRDDASTLAAMRDGGFDMLERLGCLPEAGIEYQRAGALAGHTRGRERMHGKARDCGIADA